MYHTGRGDASARTAAQSVPGPEPSSITAATAAAERRYLSAIANRGPVRDCLPAWWPADRTSLQHPAWTAYLPTGATTG
jgi:hypothetical protein